MFTSEKNSKQVRRTMFIYLGIGAFVALFGAVYELNSHNVFSAAMVFACRYPLILGALMYLFMYFLPTKKVPGILVACIYHFGVAMATTKAIFIGVIDIYGTTNRVMVTVYTILAWVFVLLGLALYIIILVYWTIKNKPRLEIEQPSDKRQ